MIPSFPWVRNPTAIDKIPCGDRDGIVTISVGSEPTAIDKIPCGDRDAASYRFRGFGTHGY